MGILLSKFVLFLNYLKFQSTSFQPEVKGTEQGAFSDSDKFFNSDMDKYDNLDRISELPDELFGVILSHLSIKDVVRTRRISHRWKNLWKLTERLDLDCHKSAYSWSVSETDKLSYVKWVNHIIESHEGAKLQEFRVCYGLDKRFEHDIDKWVKFAFLKQVQNFDLEVRPSSNQYRPCGGDNYILTTHLMETIVNKKSNGFKYLKTLRLESVAISAELLELILKNSPALEQLRIKCQWWSSIVRVGGSQCVLKCLELNCPHELLEISNVASLVSLTLLGLLPKKLIIQNVPLVTSFCFSGFMIDEFFDLKLNDLLAQFSSSLKSLTLEIIYGCESFGSWMWMPKLNSLEKLVVRTTEFKPSTTNYGLLTKLCPSLREFVFQAHVGCSYVALPDGNPEIYKDPDPHHECLREVKILGYYGCKRDIETVLYFVQNAVALEKIVIDPRCQHSYFYHWKRSLSFDFQQENEQDARTRAKEQLQGKVPPRIELVIL